jgi:hypothetical protein
VDGPGRHHSSTSCRWLGGPRPLHHQHAADIVPLAYTGGWDAPGGRRRRREAACPSATVRTPTAVPASSLLPGCAGMHPAGAGMVCLPNPSTSLWLLWPVGMAVGAPTSVDRWSLDRPSRWRQRRCAETFGLVLGVISRKTVSQFLGWRPYVLLGRGLPPTTPRVRFLAPTPHSRGTPRPSCSASRPPCPSGRPPSSHRLTRPAPRPRAPTRSAPPPTYPPAHTRGRCSSRRGRSSPVPDEGADGHVEVAPAHRGGLAPEERWRCGKASSKLQHHPVACPSPSLPSIV